MIGWSISRFFFQQPCVQTPVRRAATLTLTRVWLEKSFYKALLNSWLACPSWIIFRSEHIIEVTIVPVQGMTAHGERDVAPPILIFTTSWEWLVRFTLRSLYRRERPGTHCIGGWVGPRGRSGRFGEVANKPRTNVYVCACVYACVYIYILWCINPGYQVAEVSKFFTVLPNICGSSVWTCFVSPFKRLKFCGGS